MNEFINSRIAAAHQFAAVRVYSNSTKIVSVRVRGGGVWFRVRLCVLCIRNVRGGRAHAVGKTNTRSRRRVHRALSVVLKARLSLILQRDEMNGVLDYAQVYTD